MSTGKTLSNGTLSLRFMQNAQLAKQQAAIDLERAKVKDEAEWEVAKEIREALGLATSSKLQTGQTIVQETSYLPFLFPSLQNNGPSSNEDTAEEASTSNKISGRRTFSKGQEIVHASSSADDPADAEVKQETDAAESSTPLTEHSKARRRTGGVGPLTTKRAHKLAELDRAGVVLPRETISTSDVPVLSMISGETSAVVGMDIRQMRKLKGKEKVSAAIDDEVKLESEKTTNSFGKGPLSFLRPTGVDSPAPSRTGGKSSRKRDLSGEARDASLEPPRKKADYESASIAEASDTQRQVAKKKKKKEKQLKIEPGLSTPAS